MPKAEEPGTRWRDCEDHCASIVAVVVAPSAEEMECGVLTRSRAGSLAPPARPEQLLLEHRDAYQAGAVFPDAFYPGICQRGRCVCEQDTEKLVAFLFGVTSHMVADVSWHSLGIEQGFLRTMAAMDFHGSYSEAHPAGDFGGDVLSQFEFNFNYLARHWYVPVEDLLGIYRKLYGKDVITKHVIVECSYLQFLEMYGEVLAVSKVQPPPRNRPARGSAGPGSARCRLPSVSPQLYPTYSRKSPFLVEQFQDYFLGGLDDMAFWSTNIYRLTSHMLAHGTRYVPVEDLLGIYRKLYGKDVITKHVIVECSYLQFLEMYGEVLAVSKLYPTYSRKSPFLVEQFQDYFLGGLDDMAFWSTNIYRLTSHMLAHGTRDCSLPENPLFIACGGQRTGPQGSSQVQKSDAHRNLTASLTKDAGKNVNYTARGAVFSVDSWTSDSMSFMYQTLERNLRTLFTGSSQRPRKHMSSPLASYFLSCPYARLGWWVRVCLAPCVCLSLSFDRWNKLNVEAADWRVRGEEDYAWLGYSLHAVPLDNRTLLLAGSPTWKNSSGLGRLFHSRDEKQSLGRVDGYFPPGRQSAFSISGDKSPALTVWFVPDDVSKMAFLTMTLHQGGATPMSQLSPAARPALLSTFSGDRRFSRFGGVLHLSDLDGDGLDEVLMAAPLRIADMTSGLIGGEDGRVYVYNGRRTFSGDMTGKCKSWTSPCPEEKASSRFGSGLVTVRSKDKNQVVVAAERSSLGARLAGALHVYSLGSDRSPARVPATPRTPGEPAGRR
ncbi:Phosphatidylinositol-glycan-specific phospholipase D [Myotis brandtii]|uniref:Phosphatidylinositol-glycan-specific phospholipase D n=1 Tax=Myotis brandtii TaxID=109478 RepID=S7MNM5_MYOBR|nr:Phosphatidylinositol-glycan-specific phospholipase D [Myotis brandtii]